MELRWPQRAADDLENLADYLFHNAPWRVAELVRGLYEAPGALLAFPNRGRPGRKSGTRELVLTPLPYIVVYQISGDVIYIVRIIHGAQKWP